MHAYNPQFKIIAMFERLKGGGVMGGGGHRVKMLPIAYYDRMYIVYN